MRINLYNERRRYVGRVDVDLSHPARAAHLVTPRGSREERFLDWDRAFDDEGHLRKCPACGCEDLYRRSLIPPLTGFIIVLVVGLVTLLLWGLTTAPLWMVWVALAAVGVANVLIHFMGPEMLVCYRCTSQYHGAKVSAGQAAWDAAVEAKYRAQPPGAPPAATPSANP